MNKKDVVASLVILIIILCVGLIFYSGQRALHYIGPSKLLAGQDGVLYVVSHGKIHLFDRSGTRISAFDLRDFGRELTPSDLAVYRDGRFLLSDPSEPGVYRCDPRSKACEQFKLVIGTFAHISGNSLKFFIDESAGRIYFSDNAGHRVLITNLDGMQLSNNDRAKSKFWFPNQLWKEADHSLLVVNTNFQKLMAVDVTGDEVGKERWSMSTKAGPPARPDRVWPFAAVHTDEGLWWVLNAREGMKDADLVQFDAGGNIKRRIDLGAESDPFGILLWNDRLLVADAMQFRIQSVSRDYAVGEDFGDAAFRLELRHAHASPVLWRKVRVGAQVAVVVFPLIGILLLWLLRSQEQTD